LSSSYIAIDWGTTNRRAYRMAADGTVLDTIEDARGVLALTADDYPREAAALRDRLGPLPILAAGMVGSNRGWREAAYAPVPAGLSTLAQACVRLDDEDVVIVPGVSLRSERRTDVMRGEEVQVLGAVSAGLAPADALFCQPGTHNKWIQVAGGRIVDFATAMTGELFALLRDHGVLAGMLDDRVEDGPAFRRGLARGAGAGDLAVALFEVRSGVLLGALARADAAAFASGILIGADVGARRDLAGRDVHLLASGPLAALYAAAIAAAGGRAVTIDSRRAFAAGIHQIWELIR
jgi:2-dehydro-3-deoxygalactonokinase